MFADYLKEEEGYETITTDYGFCSYVLDRNTAEFFCAHLYVKPEYRKKGRGIDFGMELEKFALKNGAKRMTGNIWFNNANKGRFTEKIKIFEAFGFEIETINSNVITMCKKISEE